MINTLKVWEFTLLLNVATVTPLDLGCTVIFVDVYHSSLSNDTYAQLEE